jgi:Subtilase family.
MSSDVICFNCRSIVPHWKNCANCAAPLLGDAADTADSLVENANKTATRLNARAVVQMDPHLHRLTTLVQERGIRQFSTSTARVNEVSVIARVTDVEAFKSLDRVQVISVIAPVTHEDDWIVTARMPLDYASLEAIRLKPFVLALKAARRLSPCLKRTCEETLAMPAQLPPNNLAQGGKGVIIGIIDFGLDFTHKNFCNPDNTSRILALWDQTLDANPGSPANFRYGTEHRKADIDAALQTADPFGVLKYTPSTNSSLQLGAHATAVTDVAAGNGRVTGCPGIAPQADIVFVDLSTKEIPAGSPAVFDNSFGDTARLVDAVNYIFDFAGDRPCVINISLATNGGPHDGSTPVEKAIDQAVSQAPNRAVVIAAGNAFNQKIHAVGKVADGGKVALKWHIAASDPSSNELEIWYPKEDRLTVKIFDPDNNSVFDSNNLGFRLETDQFDTAIVGEGFVSAHNRLNDSGKGDNLINVFLDRRVPAGDWTIELHGDSVQDGTFHAWIERDELGPTEFVPVQDHSYKVTDDCTLGSISCGEKTIVVGAYSAHKPGQPLFIRSSAGKTRDGRKKPDISAPGHLVLAADSREITPSRQTGTSLSAPAVAGVIALMLAAAKARGISLTTERIREILIDSARKDPPPANGQPLDDEGWHPQYGFGRVSAAAAVAAVIAMA